MNECEKFLLFANPALDTRTDEEEDLVGWEERVSKEGWTRTIAQSKLYGMIMKVLSQDRLARLALEGPRE